MPLARPRALQLAIDDQPGACSVPRGGGWRPGARWARADGQTQDEVELYLPRGLNVPASLRPIVSETVSTGAITRGWDPLLRIAASTKSGWCSATYVLDRFGSAAQGDEAFQAGDAFGRLLLTRFLGAYLGDPAFRGMNDALLSQGESVHTLQRAIYSGPIGARHGRTPEQMAAISSGLTLPTNVIMT